MLDELQVRCTGEVFVKDDRYGGWTNQCELPAYHEGDHRHALRACEPIAYMGWGDFDGTTEGVDHA